MYVLSDAHVGIYMIIELQKEQQDVESQTKSTIRVQPMPKPRKATVDQENRLMTIINDRLNRTIMDYLRGIAHNVSF